MRLKSLSIRGFKSFADKTVLDFEARPGVTAFIGPNGCGKSNIIDAFRWVLGETNPRDLRSPSLEEVIFSGTHTRKPLSLAEVTLTLDNSDRALAVSYDEVEVRRRVYRSGESEFFINRNPCRLKDIRDLFLDTGLGQSGYSILTQGQVDAILLAKPEERQVVFEEAVGVAKFRVRKDEAIRKLETASQNLSRVRDLLDHLTRELAVMEETHEKAKLKRTLLTRASDLDLFVMDRDRKSLLEKLKAVELEMKRLESITESGESVATSGERLQELRSGLRAARLRYEESQERYQAIQKKLGEGEKADALAEQEWRLQRQMLQSEVTEIEKEIRAEELLHVERQKFLKDKEAEFHAAEAQADSVQDDDGSRRKEMEELSARIGILQKQEQQVLQALSAHQKMGSEAHTMANLPAELRRFPRLREKIQVSSDLHVAAWAALAHHMECRLFPEGKELQEIVLQAKDQGWPAFSGMDVSITQWDTRIENAGTLSQPGVVGWLHQLIGAGNGTEGILHSLVGPTLVVEDMRTAFRTWAERKGPWAIVTLDGLSISDRGYVHFVGNLVGVDEKSADDRRAELEKCQGERGRLQDVLRRVEMEEVARTASENISRLRLEELRSELDRWRAHFHAESERLLRKKEHGARKQAELERFRPNVSTSEPLRKLTDEHTQAMAEVQTRKQEYMGITDELESAEKAWLLVEKELRARQESLTQARINQARWQIELDALVVRAEEQHGISRETWEGWNSPLSLTREAARREFLELRRQLEVLGDVSLGSDTLYDRLKDRQRFLAEGAKDVEGSVSELEGEIGQLEEQASAAFTQGMERIQVEFERMFSLLFHGGEAKLLVQNGIEIMIKPPGRRWMPLTLLSGGERSLTAVALLFALFQLRPSPFSLLDEVDAALDEANVGRFVGLIQDFAKTIQVLVVTHNRKTMEAGESIYGVTMEEAGVSKVVSLKLETVPA